MTKRMNPLDVTTIASKHRQNLAIEQYEQFKSDSNLTSQCRYPPKTNADCEMIEIMHEHFLMKECND